MLSFLPGPEYHLNNTVVQDYNTGQVLYLDPDFISKYVLRQFQTKFTIFFFLFLDKSPDPVPDQEADEKRTSLEKSRRDTRARPRQLQARDQLQGLGREKRSLGPGLKQNC